MDTATIRTKVAASNANGTVKFKADNVDKINDVLRSAYLITSAFRHAVTTVHDRRRVWRDVVSDVYTKAHDAVTEKFKDDKAKQERAEQVVTFIYNVLRAMVKGGKVLSIMHVDIKCPENANEDTKAMYDTGNTFLYIKDVFVDPAPVETTPPAPVETAPPAPVGTAPSAKSAASKGRPQIGLHDLTVAFSQEWSFMTGITLPNVTLIEIVKDDGSSGNDCDEGAGGAGPGNAKKRKASTSSGPAKKKGECIIVFHWFLSFHRFSPLHSLYSF